MNLLLDGLEWGDGVFKLVAKELGAGGAFVGCDAAVGGDCIAGGCGGVCGALVELCADSGEGYGDDHGECFGVREGRGRGVHAAVSVSAAEWGVGDGAGCAGGG